RKRDQAILQAGPPPTSANVRVEGLAGLVQTSVARFRHVFWPLAKQLSAIGTSERPLRPRKSAEETLRCRKTAAAGRLRRPQQCRSSFAPPASRSAPKRC